MRVDAARGLEAGDQVEVVVDHRPAERRPREDEPDEEEEEEAGRRGAQRPHVRGW